MVDKRRIRNPAKRHYTVAAKLDAKTMLKIRKEAAQIGATVSGYIYNILKIVTEDEEEKANDRT